MDKKERKEKIKILKNLKYTNINQIARVIGVERKIIERIFLEKGKKK